MAFVEALQLASSTGVLAMGSGIFKWALGVERRLTIVETKQEGKE